MRQAGRYLPEYRATRARPGISCRCATIRIWPPRSRCSRSAATGSMPRSCLPISCCCLRHWGRTCGSSPAKARGCPPSRPRPRLAALKGLRRDPRPPCPGLRNRAHPVARIAVQETTLIGFAGAPWTVATYMIAGRGTPDQGPAHALKAENRAVFDALMELSDGGQPSNTFPRQVQAWCRGGQNLRQLGRQSLSGRGFRQTYALRTGQADHFTAALKSRYPGLPVIAFPRQAGERLYWLRIKATGADCVALDNWL